MFMLLYFRFVISSYKCSCTVNLLGFYMGKRHEFLCVYIHFHFDTDCFITQISVKSRSKLKKGAWIQLRLPSNRFLSVQALSSAVFRIIPPVMPLNSKIRWGSCRESRIHTKKWQSCGCVSKSKRCVTHNRPFPSCHLPLCQDESSCEVIVKIHSNQTHFHKKTFCTKTVKT